MKKTILSLRAGLLVAGLALAAVQASAAIVYVDATYNSTTGTPTTANTTLAAGGPFGSATFSQPAGTGLSDPANASSTDNLWRERTGFGNGPSGTNLAATASIYEALGNNAGTSGANGEDVPRLKTNVSGLAVGSYDVWAFWWQDQNGSPWRLEASLTDNPGGALTLYTPYNNTSVQSSTLTFSNPIPTRVDGANRIMWASKVGTVTNTSFFDVFVDSDFALQAGPVGDGNSRTWYDGVGYERVVPEPTSIALLGLGLGMLIVGRRKGRATT